MKIPATPPNHHQILYESIQADQKSGMKLFSNFNSTDDKGRYLHWDKLRYLEPPEGFSSEQWWAGMKIAREKTHQDIALKDKNKKKFKFSLPNLLQKELHWLDINSAGNISSKKAITNPQMRNTYIIKSLVEEAICSSQLEGASTTRNVAKEMIRQRREPKNKSEQMILNNFYAMQFIREYKKENLTVSMILELHKILTGKTLDNSNDAGKFRTDSDDIKVIDSQGNVLHVPPKADELKKRMNILCEFANKRNEDVFIHPVLKAIMLHFMLAYDHPFVDGNGRTARALFYWAMANQGYWLIEFISISKIIKNAPVKYNRAFLYTETDDNDVTYFNIHQLTVIKDAIKELQKYLEKKMDDIENTEKILSDNKKLKSKLNFRQIILLKHALKHPRYIYNINEHKNTNGISYETARKDLLTLSDNLNLFSKLKDGKSFVFLSPTDLYERIDNH